MSEPSAALLLEHAQFLRRIARALLHDADAADDVAQQAMVEALRARPENLSAWLGKVARHLALTRRRAETRRERHERAAARPEALPSAAEGVARLELQRRVVDAVLALDEPYRSVVVHRFFWDLGPKEIAERLGVPVETVRTRLRRALERLRARLDETHGRAAWSVALLAIAAPRKLPLGGILAMSAKTKIAAASVLALACAALGVSVLARRDAPPPRAPLTQEARLDREPAGPPAAGSPVPPPVDFAAVDRDRDVHGVVVDAAGEPVALAEVRVLRDPSAGAGFLARLETLEGPGTRTAADGSFALRCERGEEVDLRVRAEGFVTLRRRWCPAGGKVRIVMRKGVSLRVRAVGPDGEPLAGVQVVAFKGREAEMEAAGVYVYLFGATDGLGSCVLPDLLPDRDLQVAAWHDDFAFPGPIAVRLPAAGEAEVTLVGDADRVLSGRVTDAATGAPVADAVVTPYPAVVSFAKLVRTDADGRYRYGGWGDDRALFVHAEGYASAREEVGDRERVDFALDRGVTVKGVVRDLLGAPIAGAFVGAFATDKTEIRETRSDEEGRFELRDLERARVLVAAKPGFARAQVPIEGDGIEVVLSPGHRVEGRVLGPDGEPVAGVDVDVTLASFVEAGDRPSRVPEHHERHTDDLGRFRFADLPACACRVSARRGDRDVSRDVVIGDGGVLDVELRFEEPSARPGREFTVQVVDDAGRPVPGVYVRSVYQPRGKAADAHGRVTLEMHEDVDVEQVQVSKIDKRYAQPPNAFYRAGDGELRIVLHDAAPVSGEVLLDGKPLALAVIHCRGPGDFWTYAVTGKDGRFSLRAPVRTRVDVFLTGQVKQDMLPIYGERKDVAAGTEGLVILARRAALDRTLRVRVVTPGGEGVPDMEVTPKDARGWRPGDQLLRTDASGRLELTGLPAAEFSVVLFSDPPAPWAQAKPREMRVTPDGGEVVFTLREGKPIRGVLRKPDGTGALAGVVAFRGDERVGFARSEEDGSFVLYVPAEEPGPFRLEAYPDDPLTGEAVSVESGAQGVMIRLRPR